MKRALATAALGAVTVLTLTACTDDPPAASGAADGPSERPSLHPGDVSCPNEDPARQQDGTFRRSDPAAPRIEASLYLDPLGPRDFCLQPVIFDPVALQQHLVSYELSLPEDGFNYGEHYGTTDRTGSDELLNFPFAFHVYGPCRAITSTLVIRTGGHDFEYVADLDAGPRCSGE